MGRGRGKDRIIGLGMRNPNVDSITSAALCALVPLFAFSWSSSSSSTVCASFPLVLCCNSAFLLWPDVTYSTARCCSEPRGPLVGTGKSSSGRHKMLGQDVDRRVGFENNPGGGGAARSKKQDGAVASQNFFALLGDVENEDPTALIERASLSTLVEKAAAKKQQQHHQAPAKLPSKPAPQAETGMF